MLGKLGHTVLISKFGEYFRLGAYLSRCTNKMIGIAMGIPSLVDLFQEKYYTNLEGGILESLGRLFKNDLKLYVYPVTDEKTGELLNVRNLKVAPNLQNLYDHLVEKPLHRRAGGLQTRVFVDLLASRFEADPER